MTFIVNNVIPMIMAALSLVVNLKTKSRILFFDIWNNEITRIIQSLNLNKAHGYNGTSIHVLKL